ncbi:MAG: hypothetical protein MJY99_07360 [Fibrobacter sp.]|nr:hypothetical protein [Fibrobacter sp.]
MNEFLSRNKYRLSTLFVVSLSLFVVVFFVVPRASVVAETLASVRAQLEISKTLQGDVTSPDSLIREYRKISEKIEKHTLVQVTSSKILTFVHGIAGKSSVALQDLSTGETSAKAGKIEIPVSFKAKAAFANFHKFLTEMENGDFCIGISDVNMNREDNGDISASVRLSVVSKGDDSLAAVHEKREVDEKNLDFKGLLAHLAPQPMPSDSLRDPFQLPQAYMPAPKSVRVRTKAAPMPPAEKTPEFPDIALDAILPGDNPVAILKFHGESAVVSVGQEVWGVTVVVIGQNEVTLRFEGKTFNIR